MPFNLTKKMTPPLPTNSAFAAPMGEATKAIDKELSMNSNTVTNTPPPSRPLSQRAPSSTASNPNMLLPPKSVLAAFNKKSDSPNLSDLNEDVLLNSEEDKEENIAKTTSLLPPPLIPLSQQQEESLPNSVDETNPPPLPPVVKAPVAPLNPPPAVMQANEKGQRELAQSHQGKELRIDLSASKSLSHLVCALAINPGLGGEVDVAVRRESIQSLVSAAHELTHFICDKIKDGKHVPDYLYGAIFQEATRHVGSLWNQSESLNITPAKTIAADIFNHESPIFDAFTYEASSQKERQNLNNEERAELEMQVALMAAMSRIRTTVLSMRIGSYIDGYGEEVESLREKFALTPYLFGQDQEAKIVTDLTYAVMRIAEKHKLNAPDLDMTTTWNVGMVYRAADLVKSEYEMFVERLVRSSFNDIDLHEQALNANNDVYNVALENIEKRAEDAFSMILRTARRLALAPTPSSEDSETNQPIQEQSATGGMASYWNSRNPSTQERDIP